MKGYRKKRCSVQFMEWEVKDLGFIENCWSNLMLFLMLHLGVVDNLGVEKDREVCIIPTLK